MHNTDSAAQHDAPGLSLALQGGGALGAFTWGVLDALLEAGVDIAAASGASAGAVNAVVMAQGLMDGGPEGARKALARFWRRVSNAFPLSGAPVNGAALAALQASLQWLSPMQMNPLRIDPLKEILEDEIDFAALRERSPLALLISATRVRDGSARIFRTHEISVEAVLASACLPLLNHSVEVDGEWCWDGGYSANPPLRELAWTRPGGDILLVDLTVPAPGRPPARVRDIERRVHELALSSSMHREVEALEDLNRLGRQGGGPLARLHRISARQTADGVSFADALNADWTALSRLKDAGAAAGRRWLAGQDQEPLTPAGETAADGPLKASLHRLLPQARRGRRKA
ncbi:patatin-like phospholipase family protein [Phenylobacterium sp.]|uniref:patatin-like phospholipase family protein n=1 Tax=Phenylobacterium sp. TaxID=1871053 RepID=UPI0035B499C5